MKIKVGSLVKLTNLDPGTAENLQYQAGMVGVVCRIENRWDKFNYLVKFIGDELGETYCNLDEIELFPKCQNYETIKNYLGIE